jgi:large subunit ribosomal protein L11
MGQALGPLGINMMQFCKDFNEKTSHIRPDVPMKVVVVAFADRTFKYYLKPPETTWFLKKAMGTWR